MHPGARGVGRRGSTTERGAAGPVTKRGRSAGERFAELIGQRGIGPDFTLR